MALMSPALAGGFLTTEPPGKPESLHFCFETWTLTILDFDVCTEKREGCPSRPETAALSKACLQGGLWTGVWELGFWGHAHHSFMYKWLTEPKLLVQIMCFMLNTCFPSGSLAFWHVRGRR